MTYPEMILFDYGHTLIYEPALDDERGIEAVLKYATRNKNNLSAKEIAKFLAKLFNKTVNHSRKYDFELHQFALQRLLYEYLEIEIPLPQSELEQIFWFNAAPGTLMPNIDKVIDYLNQNSIRSGVISNICFSGESLEKRINLFLPNNKFEFVIASSDYIIRKPDPMIFELALKKAELTPDKVWYCGDYPEFDAAGANSAGIFPVWYQSELECSYRDKDSENPPKCEHLHITDWAEMIDVLDKLK